MSRLLSTARAVFRQSGFPGLLATCFTLGLAHSFVLPYLSLWGTEDVGMSSWSFGLFMTVTTLCGIILNTVFARWSDARLSRRTVLLIGAAGGALGHLGYAFVTNQTALFIIGALAVGVSTVNFSQLFAHAREEMQQPGYDPASVPFLMSVLRVCFSFAWVGGPWVAGTIMGEFDTRGVLTAAAILYVVFAVGIVSFVRVRPRPPVEDRAPQTPFREVMLRPDILTYFIGFVFVFMTHTLAWTNLPLLFTHELGGADNRVAWVFGIAPAIELPLMLWFGKLATSGRQLRLIQLGVGVNALYFIGLYLAQSWWHVFPIQILSAIAVAITTNITITFFQDLLPGQAGVATSMFGNAYSVGMLLGYLSFGTFNDSLGHRGICALSAVLCATALLMFLVRARRAAPPVVEDAVEPWPGEDLVPRCVTVQSEPSFGAKRD